MIGKVLRSSLARHAGAFTVGTVLGGGVVSVTQNGQIQLSDASVERHPVSSSLKWSFTDGVRGLSRFCDCAVSFVVVAADYKISLLGANPESESYALLKSKIHERSAIRLRAMCCRNGGVFVKVAQHLGSLDYLLPPEYVNVMRLLHSKAPYSPLSDVRQIVKEELGAPLDELFSYFDEIPCGAASLAQAHKAKLRDSDDLVVVKVQHKSVKKFSNLDMKTMEFLVGVAEKFFPEFRFRWLVEITKANLPLELDFLHEADNCETAEKTYKHLSAFLKFPKIYRNVSTNRVLTMEFCEGCQVDDLAFMKENGINEKEVVTLLGRLYSDMIFTRGLMHCDPHPGNLLVQKNPKTGKVKLVLLDHGLYQQLSEKFRLDYCRLWLSLISGDVDAIRRAAATMDSADSAEIFACMVAGRSWKSVIGGDVAVKTKTLAEDYEIQDHAVRVVPQMTSVLDRVPRQLLLVLKTNDLIRGIQTKLRCPSELSAFLAQTRACFWALATADLSRCWSMTNSSDAKNRGLVRSFGRVVLASWCSVKVTASLLIRLFQVKVVEYSFAFSSYFQKAKLRADPKALLLNIGAAA